MKKNLLAKNFKKKEILLVFFLGVVVGALGYFFITANDGDATAALNIPATKRATSYLESKSQFKDWICAVQVIGVSSQSDYARFECNKIPGEEAVCDVAKLDKNPQGDIISMEIPDEANYESNITRLLPNEPLEVYDYYAGKYGCRDLSAMNVDRIQIKQEELATP